MNIKTVLKNLSAVTDARRQWGNKRHKLEDILIIALCSTICGGEDFEDMELLGKERIVWLQTFLELPGGIPDGDTFRRVLERVKPSELAAALYGCLDDVRELAQKTVAIDGKTICGSGSQSHKAYHVVSAWVSENKMILGEVATQEKSNEITAIPKLLNLVDIEGSVVTIDAMGCQKEITQKICEKKANYVIGLKGNQGTLSDDVRLYYEQFKNSQQAKTLEKGHGRIETRQYFLETNIDWLWQRTEWAGLNAVGMVKTRVLEKDIVREETRYFISSLTDVEDFAKAVREHWGIENGLHWCLDVIFGEDSARMTKDNSPLNMNVLRKTALALLRKTEVGRLSVKHKMFRAAMNHQFLHQIVF